MENKKIIIQHIEEREEWLITWMDGKETICDDLNEVLEKISEEYNGK